VQRMGVAPRRAAAWHDRHVRCPWTAANRTQSARRCLWNYRPSKPHPRIRDAGCKVARVDRDESGDLPIGRRRAISSRVPHVDVWPAGEGEDEHDGAAVSRWARESRAGHVADWNLVDQVGESPCRVLGEQIMRGERERWQVVQPAVPAHQPTSRGIGENEAPVEAACAIGDADGSGMFRRCRDLPTSESKKRSRCSGSIGEPATDSMILAV
jgi:hypothetical protein